MKSITVRQPWASLIAAGAKTIETRPRRTGYRGRIAIHAAKAKPAQGAIVGPYVIDWGLDPAHTTATSGWDQDGCGHLLIDDESNSTPLPLGAVVASAVLTDCVPIVDTTDQEPYDHPSGRFVAWDSDCGVFLVEPAGQTEPEYRSNRLIEDQLPFGDFSPGGWALLLDDIKPTTERCPYCWGDGADPACTVRACQADTSVPAVQEVIAAARRRFAPCPVCDGDGICEPVRARGQQAVPWEWTPEAAGNAHSFKLGERP